MSEGATPKMEPTEVHTIVRRATVGETAGSSVELAPDSAAAGRPRRKSITTACERCRRRKIRCDGNQPCATCARFSVSCVRPSKHKEKFGPEAQAALEERVRRLEAQLADAKHGTSVDVDDDLFQAWADENDPSSDRHMLRLDTEFSQPQRSYSYDDGLGDLYSATSLTSPIPMIEITGCDTPFSRAMSPSPSLLSGSATSRASTPDPYKVTTPSLPPSNLAIPKAGPSISPPISPFTLGIVNAWDYAASEDFLSPSAGPGISRRSSMSSLALDVQEFPAYQDPSSSFGDNTGTYLDDLHYSPPASALGSQSGQGFAMPPVEEARQLAQLFFQRLLDTQTPMPLEPQSFQVCLEGVYTLPSYHSLGSPELEGMLPCSLRSAKFQVFLILATALRMLGDHGKVELSEILYGLAMQQAASSDFWHEDGGVQMAHLLAIFAATTTRVS